MRVEPKEQELREFVTAWRELMKEHCHAIAIVVIFHFQSVIKLLEDSLHCILYLSGSASPWC